MYPNSMSGVGGACHGPPCHVVHIEQHNVKWSILRRTTGNLTRLPLSTHRSVWLCRHHKLRVLVGGWWHKSNRPAPQDIFLDYDEIPKEPRLFLERCADVTYVVVPDLLRHLMQRAQFSSLC